MMSGNECKVSYVILHAPDLRYGRHIDNSASRSRLRLVCTLTQLGGKFDVFWVFRPHSTFTIQVHVVAMEHAVV